MKVTKTAILMSILMIGLAPAISFPRDLLDKIEMPSSPNPVGSGARALGMGGAFIAVADDATAASWNPAGLIQLRMPEISFVGESFHRIEDNSFGNFPESSGNQTVSKTDINYLSAACPFKVFGNHMVVSANFQHLYDFTRQWSFPRTVMDEDGHYQENFEYRLEGDLSAVGIAFSFQAAPMLFCGLSLNFWDDGLSPNGWRDERYRWGKGLDEKGAYAVDYRRTDKYSVKGFNANLGIFWKPDPRLILGAVLKTPFTADVRHDVKSDGSIWYEESAVFDENRPIDLNDLEEDLDMPVSYGIGASYRITANLTVSADVCRTEWGDFIHTDSDGNEVSPITGKKVSESDVRPTHQARTGIEYLVVTPKFVLPIRGGAFYDPMPADGSPDSVFGLSLGSGLGYERFVFDIAYQYRFGNDVGSGVLEDWRFSQSIREHTVYSSLIVYF